MQVGTTVVEARQGANGTIDAFMRLNEADEEKVELARIQPELTTRFISAAHEALDEACAMTQDSNAAPSDAGGADELLAFPFRVNMQGGRECCEHPAG